MASLIETLISEMVKQREAEERTVVALERLMKWVEEMELELDGEESEVRVQRRGTIGKMNIVLKNKKCFFLSEFIGVIGVSENIKTQ